MCDEDPPSPSPAQQQRGRHPLSGRPRAVELLEQGGCQAVGAQVDPFKVRFESSASYVNFKTSFQELTPSEVQPGFKLHHPTRPRILAAAANPPISHKRWSVRDGNTHPTSPPPPPPPLPVVRRCDGNSTGAAQSYGDGARTLMRVRTHAPMARRPQSSSSPAHPPPPPLMPLPKPWPWPSSPSPL